MSQSQEWKSGREESFLSSLTLKKISQMREGLHANVKAVVITSRLVLRVRVKLGFGELREYMFDM